MKIEIMRLELRKSEKSLNVLFEYKSIFLVSKIETIIEGML